MKSDHESKLNILLAGGEFSSAEILRDYLNNHTQNLNVTGFAADGKEAAAIAGEHRADVILLNFSLRETENIEALKVVKARHPNIKIFVLSARREIGLARSALLAGASGYLLEDISPASLAAAIRALENGIVQISPEIVHDLARERDISGTAEPPPENTKQESFEWLKDLTNREREIFNLIAAGHENKQIAEKLNLAIQTVRNQVCTIYSKLGVKNRFEIIRFVNRAEKQPVKR